MRRLIVSLLTFAALSAAPTVHAQPAGKACQAAENRQLDFWVGSWKAYQAKSGAFDGDSKVEPIYGGCVMRENWTDQNGMVGGSFNRFDTATGQWRQTWVDSTGRQNDYVGHWAGDRMEYVARQVGVKDPSRVLLRRMTLSPLPDGTVRQLFENSTDDGKTWAPVWDLIYRRIQP